LQASILKAAGYRLSLLLDLQNVTGKSTSAGRNLPKTVDVELRGVSNASGDLSGSFRAW
jgi:hypothetical protein